MLEVELGEVIATRLFQLADVNSRKEVFVKIGKPRAFSEALDYFCPYQISGFGDEKIRYAAGIDQVQALQLAIAKIGADLFALNRACNGGLRWAGDGRGDLGFPRP